jgi:IS5 family transposase
MHHFCCCGAKPKAGRPRLPMRLMISLLYLKHAFDESDEGVVDRWSETPIWQQFSGMDYYEHRRPCDSTVLVKFRKLLGEAGGVARADDQRGGEPEADRPGATVERDYAKEGAYLRHKAGRYGRARQLKRTRRVIRLENDRWPPSAADPDAGDDADERDPRDAGQGESGVRADREPKGRGA